MYSIALPRIYAQIVLSAVHRNNIVGNLSRAEGSK